MALCLALSTLVASLLEESGGGFVDALLEVPEAAEDDAFRQFVAAVVEVLLGHARIVLLLHCLLLLVIEHNDAILFVDFLLDILLVIEDHDIFIGEFGHASVGHFD